MNNKFAYVARSKVSLNSECCFLVCVQESMLLSFRAPACDWNWFVCKDASELSILGRRVWGRGARSKVDRSAKVFVSRWTKAMSDRIRANLNEGCRWCVRASWRVSNQVRMNQPTKRNRFQDQFESKNTFVLSVGKLLAFLKDAFLHLLQHGHGLWSSGRVDSISCSVFFFWDQTKYVGRVRIIRFESVSDRTKYPKGVFVDFFQIFE